MSALLWTLLHLKRKRLEAERLALRLKRAELVRADERCRRAEQALQAARTSYPREVEALYAPVLARTTDLNRLEEIAGQVGELDLRIERLEEDLHDAADHLEDLGEEHREMVGRFLHRLRRTGEFESVVREFETARRRVEERREELAVEHGRREWIA